ncbi:MAG: FHA domain-containing protein [Aeriscardovia sp.]|nr:FHA domain-containing protein [Aeriscardovia sp.]
MDEETYPYPEPPAFGWYAEDYAWGKEHGLDDNGEPLRPYAKPAVRLFDEPDGFTEQGSAEAGETAAAGSLVSPEAGSQADASRPTYEDDGRDASRAGKAATANGGASGSADARPTPSEDGGAGHVSTAGGETAEPVQPAILVLRNSSNGQSIPISRDCVLGRKPDAQNYPGIQVVRLSDSTRTVSREHALVRLDAARRQVWIEDLGSLNGTYIVRGECETRVVPGNPQLLEPGALLRIGDEFYEISQR